MLISHRLPKNPGGHLHKKPPSWSSQTALFKHGLDWHSLTSVSQCRPGDGWGREGARMLTPWENWDQGADSLGHAASKGREWRLQSHWPTKLVSQPFFNKLWLFYIILGLCFWKSALSILPLSETNISNEYLIETMLKNGTSKFSSKCSSVSLTLPLSFTDHFLFWTSSLSVKCR